MDFAHVVHLNILQFSQLYLNKAEKMKKKKKEMDFRTEAGKAQDEPEGSYSTRK